MKGFATGLIALFALLVCTMAHADVEAGKAKAQVCFACHGQGGNSTVGTFPILAGQNARYIYLELRYYKSGARKHPVMSKIAAGLSPQDMQDLADYFAAQPKGHTTENLDPAKIKQGEATADQMLCSMCHMGGLVGQNEIPRLAGQHPEYIAQQLKNFRSGARTNDAGNMSSLAVKMTDSDIEALAQYIGSLE